jgi:hypothetical protein
MWFAGLFPDLLKEHGIGKRVDVRCGFSKNFLEGNIKEAHTS